MRFRRRTGRRALVRTLGLTTAAVVGVLAIGTTVSAQTQPGPDRTIGRELPAHIADLRLERPEATTAATADFLRPGLGAQSGRVIIRLSAESGAVAHAHGRSETSAKAAAHAQQDAFINRVRSIDSGARLVARTQLVLNAVFVEVDASKLADIARDSAVVSINPVGNYELDLSETVPYIGATAVQNAKTTGKGIKVAVLDSGIDYTHAALGGSGNPADYANNDPDIIEPGTFPTAKVKGGYDFVGSAWPGAPEAPDPDPLDDGPQAGHGTHVADIIGGKRGVAPGVHLYGVKVCSSVSTSCSGIALIQGMEWTLDPNGDGRMNDRMHIVNMSLGASYGQPFDDDLSLAVDNATKVGVLTVASAGNSADKPYATGTPSAADSALSVAQTSVPSAVLQLLRVVSSTGATNNYAAVFQPWAAPLTGTLSGPIQFGNGAGGATLGCSIGGDPNSLLPGTGPYPAGSLAGKIVLVNRGTCSFSVKIFNIQRGGGIAGLIGLVDSSDPFEGGFGGGDITIPAYMISQANANAIRTAITGGGATGTLDPANGIPLVGHMVGSSSRGPQHESTHRIKPEIGAPGASISAVAGSGTGTEAFGGTSGAAPMVSGAAALVLDANGGAKATPQGRPPGHAFGLGLTPLEVKARLMNNAETNIISNPLSGALAEITRIGGGEVRVDRAVKAPIAAWVDGQSSSALGFGFVDVDGTWTAEKTVRIRNYAGGAPRNYTITPKFRFAGDAGGAVSVSAPASINVRPGQGRDTTFTVEMTIDGSKLPGNFMNSGSMGATPAALTANEYDGYLELKHGTTHTLNIPWHVLPRKAAKVVPSKSTIAGGGSPEVIGLNNQGVGTAQVDAYALVAESPDIPSGPAGRQSPTPDIRAVGVNTIPVPAGFCSANPSFLWLFAINTHERQEHLMPVSHQVYLDLDQNGVDDFAVINRDVTLNNITDGRQLAWAVNLATGAASAFFFAEHSTNTGNTVLIVCGEQVGMNASNFFQNIDMAVVAQDFYYGGPGDLVEGLTVAPLGERFVGAAADVPGNTNNAAALEVYDFGPLPGNTPELGLLLVTNGDRGAGNRGGATQATEALLLKKT